MVGINKINRDIRMGKTKIGTIIFRPNDDSINWAEGLFLSSFKKLSKFYKVRNPEINLELLYFREEFDNKVGRKTPEWIVGVTLKNTIFLFNPSVIEKFSIHKKTGLNKIIAHKVCHIFNSKINKEVLNWIDEGTALFLAGQKKAKGFKKTDWQFFIDNFLDRNTNLQFFAEHEGYKISYWTIRTIVENLGTNKILDLIKINSGKNNIRNKIEQITGMRIEDFSKIFGF